jgi:hypothetical protein
LLIDNVVKYRKIDLLENLGLTKINTVNEFPKKPKIVSKTADTKIKSGIILSIWIF